MEFNIRRTNEADWDTLVEWWDSWPEWQAPPKDFLPDDGNGGIMVEKNNIPIVAGFLYFTNSNVGWLEYVISNPDYKEQDRSEAIKLLITAAENVFKGQGVKYVFSIGRNKHLINKHKELGWIVDETPSNELIKII